MLVVVVVLGGLGGLGPKEVGMESETVLVGERAEEGEVEEEGAVVVGVKIGGQGGKVEGNSKVIDDGICGTDGNEVCDGYQTVEDERVFEV